jgi:hypothetical protein
LHCNWCSKFMLVEWFSHYVKIYPPPSVTAHDIGCPRPFQCRSSCGPDDARLTIYFILRSGHSHSTSTVRDVLRKTSCAFSQYSPYSCLSLSSSPRSTCSALCRLAPAEIAAQPTRTMLLRVIPSRSKFLNRIRCQPRIGGGHQRVLITDAMARRARRREHSEPGTTRKHFRAASNPSALGGRRDELGTDRLRPYHARP